ncbi:EAL domain-containing protein [Shewanella algae]|uniref:EAL domain-containing protein n=1 Tax=Shewanella algae TaxID=38313 RepID=UPI001AAF3D16|nr:GGDEF domain-containing protein [Shewanella algae]MBO2582639.1 GGDEF domain-containing protein [Shewanella algae]
MGISRFFQLLLLLGFLATGMVLLQQERQILEQEGNTLLQRLQQAQEQAQDADDAAILYRQLQDTAPLQFFQYTDDADGQNNLTRGSFLPEMNWQYYLLPLQLESQYRFASGRVLLKPDLSPLRDQGIHTLWLAGLRLLPLYLALALIFALMMGRHKRVLKYAAEYLTKMSQGQFDSLAQSRFRGELKPLGQALEQSRQLFKQQFDKLESENLTLKKLAYEDPVTGFGTRQHFTEKLQQLSLSSKSQIGVLILVKATELGHINQLHGRQGGDDYLARVAVCIRRALQGYKNSESFRIASTDFAIFIPSIVLKDAQTFATQLKRELEEYQAELQTDSIAHTGIVAYASDKDPMGILAMADTAANVAQTLGPNAVQFQDKNMLDEKLGDNRWKLAIEDLLKRRALKFYQQPIQPCRSEVDGYRELLARFYNSEGKFLPTATVIAMAERHGMSQELDKLVLLSALKLLQSLPNLSGNIGVNLSPGSASKESFIAWARDLLSKHPRLASRLVFEINEAGMQGNLAASHKFVRAMHSVGCRVSVERFGMGFTSFKFFREVRPDYIKLDPSYTQAIDEDTNNQFFVRMLVDVARRSGVRVIACGIERQEEKMVVEKLLVDGMQGFYIAKPQQLDPAEMNRN